MLQKRRLTGLIGALALLGMVGVGGAASADEDSPSYGNIDGSAAASITIHKYQHQSGGATASPDGSGDTLANPIKDVTFTVYPLLKDGTAVDLTKPESWTGLDKLTVTQCAAPAGYTLGSGTPVTTTESGTATAPVSVGLYLVCETAAPATVVDRAAPFLVTVPYPSGGGWLYDVHVYPKNAVTAVQKSVQAPSGLGLGSTVQFPVTVSVPTLATGGALSGFIVSDSLDARLTNGQVSAVTLNGTAVDTAYYTAAASGQKLTVTFNPNGLNWLASQQGKQVVVTFQGTVASLGDGSIENTAQAFVNDPTATNGVTSNQVTTYWGDITVLKTDSSGAKTPLQGAEFEVYAAVEPYAADCAAAQPTGAAISVNGATTFTSNESGVVTIAGLYVADSTNSPSNTQRCYVLKETKAPAGYVTPSDAGAFTAVAVTSGASATGSYDVSITNVQQEVPGLPLTGAAGQVAMLAVGGMLLTAGVTLVMVRRRNAHGK